MADLFELVERVQVTLASSLDPDRAELRELHRELDTEIRLTNKRLRECDSLLVNGHRSEAIQLAEQEPNLLDVVSILDFAEFPEWNDYVAGLGLTVAPHLQIDIATDLNQAYSEDATLEQLLRRFRLFSLARAPLRKRIELVRKICELDAGNPTWPSDLQEYERTRLRQIKEEFRVARRNEDFDRLSDLAEEVRSREWTVQPSRQLLSRIEDETESLQLAFNLDQLLEVTEALQSAHAAGNLNQAASLALEWNALAGNCDQHSAEFREISTAVGGVLRWIREKQSARDAENRLTKKIERFERSLRTASGIADLERQYAAITRNGDLELPDDVQEAYDARILRLQKRKRKYLIAALTGAGLLLAIVVAVLIFRR